MPVLLQALPGDVKRQIAGIHHAFDEAQIPRKQVFTFFHDHHSLGIEPESRFGTMIEKIIRSMRRDKQQRVIFVRAFSLERQGLQRLSPIVGNVLIEIKVVFLADLRLFARPDRLHGIQDFGFDRWPLLVGRQLFAGHLIHFLF